MTLDNWWIAFWIAKIIDIFLDALHQFEAFFLNFRKEYVYLFCPSEISKEWIGVSFWKDFKKVQFILQILVFMISIVQIFTLFFFRFKKKKTEQIFENENREKYELKGVKGRQIIEGII